VFAALGVRVTLIDKRETLLDFVDQEIIDELIHEMRRNRVTLRLGEAVQSAESIDGPNGGRLQVSLESGKVIQAKKALYSIGRAGAIDTLNLEATGVESDSRGRLVMNERYQTSVPHIYAVGDVVGFPSLASTSMEQGRIAACDALALTKTPPSPHFPYGIYTISEISVVGKSEEELTKAGIPYEVGKASYRETARGQIMGDGAGLLKLIFHLETHELLGVCIIGEGASELVHIGQAVMALGGKVDFFIDTVFNYPTLAECYKTAAFDGINRLAVYPPAKRQRFATPYFWRKQPRTPVRSPVSGSLITSIIAAPSISSPFADCIAAGIHCASPLPENNSGVREVKSSCTGPPMKLEAGVPNISFGAIIEILPLLSVSQTQSAASDSRLRYRSRDTRSAS